MDNYKYHILIVEDDAISIKVATSLFERVGCQTEYVETGESAVEIATTRHGLYNGIYMDIGLPLMKGVEVCRAIRKYEAENPALLPVPIIAVTANYSEEDAKEYIKAGMQAVFFKPLTPEKIRQFLEKCLPVA